MVTIVSIVILKQCVSQWDHISQECMTPSPLECRIIGLLLKSIDWVMHYSSKYLYTCMCINNLTLNFNSKNRIA